MESHAADRPHRLAFVNDTRVMALLLAGGVIAAVVVFVVLLSTASFSEQTHSKNNQFAAGAAGLQVSKPGAIVDATNMKPGDSRTGDVEVTNTGERARLSVTVKGTAAAPALAAALNLKITTRGAPGTVLYNGPLGSAGRVELGTFVRDEKGAWTFELSLPSNADLSISGTTLDATFEWEARTP
jgi:spore coat-associated protein N